MVLMVPLEVMLPLASTANFSTPLFCPLRILPPPALLNSAAVPAGLLTCALTPIVLPVVAVATPLNPVPEVLDALALIPKVDPVGEVAAPTSPMPPVPEALPWTPKTVPLGAVAFPKIALVGAEEFTPAPVPLCVTLMIWSVVVPLKLVGPCVAAPILMAGWVAGD